jgi:hypothetical protein
VNSDRQDKIFSLLDQTGPFRTGEAPPGVRPFAAPARLWARELKERRMATKYRVIRNQLFELLDIRSVPEIRELLQSPERRQRAEERASRLLGNMFGIEGNEREIHSRIKGYAQVADGVIDFLKGKVLANYASHIELTNEIEATDSPVELLLIIYDERYSRKARFEAKRKLILMNLAGSIDQRERETDVENKFARFLGFLNEHVWSRSARIGELELAYLLSSHDPETFACTEVRVIGPRQATAIARAPGQKLTLIKRRRFRLNGREVPIYVTIRKKAPEAKVLKLLRKNEENPAVAVDDELGLMGVVDSIMDVKIFHRHLTRSASRAGSFMTLEDVSDTLSGGALATGNAGSALHTPMFKFFARMGGMRVEFIVHTNETYLNYAYQRGVSHDEYEVKRIFDSGVAELLFPREIYHLDMGRLRDKLIGWFRKRIEEFQE